MFGTLMGWLLQDRLGVAGGTQGASGAGGTPGPSGAGGAVVRAVRVVGAAETSAGETSARTQVDVWVEQARGGDAEAFNQLVRRFQALAYHVARSHVTDDELALEAAQEALISAWEGIGRFRGNGAAFRLWLIRITVSRATDVLRRHRHELAEVSWEDLANCGDMRAIAERQPSLDDLLGEREFADRLDHAIARLPETFRVVLRLDQFGLAHAEIAAVLGIARGTVRSRLWRARTEVTEYLWGASDNGATPESQPTTEPPPRRIPIALDPDGGAR